MLADKAPPPENIYLINDTHWDDKGAVLGVRAVLKQLGGKAQVEDADIVRARAKVAGDLSNLIGAPETFDSPAWRISRPVAPAVTTKESLPGGTALDVARRPPGGAPLLGGRTLFVYDSFGDRMLPGLGAYTRELASILFVNLSPAALIDAIAGSDTVILEKVERDVNYFASDQGFFTPAFLKQLKARLSEARDRR
jgi:hypothetical protein